MIDVVIVNWNCAQFTIGALTSLASVEGLGCVVIVDGGSESTDLETLRAGLDTLPNYPRLELIVLADNRGFGAANNAGFVRTSTQYVLLLNPDTMVHPGAVEVTARLLDERADIGIAACRLLNDDGSIQPSWYDLPTPWGFVKEYLFRHWRPRPLVRGKQWCAVGGVSGAFMLIRRAAVPTDYLFDEQFFMYAEEVDLCKRVRDDGWTVAYLSGVTSTHFGGGASGGAWLRPQLYIEMQRSRLRYADLHFRGAGRIVARAALKLGTLVDLAVNAFKIVAGRSRWSDVRGRMKRLPTVWRL